LSARTIRMRLCGNLRTVLVNGSLRVVRTDRFRFPFVGISPFTKLLRDQQHVPGDVVPDLCNSRPIKASSTASAVAASIYI
jgi:hypothetical protein